MGEMIGNIAHQWRQPLTQLSSILINLELHADRDRLTKEKLAGKVKEANEQIAFMSNTIDDFRNFFASGKTKKEYHIKEIIDLSSHLMSAALDRHHIALQIDIKENFTLEGYPSEVTQALVNIIKNAKEVFTERETQNPKIAIQTHQETDKKLITIEDNAGGITIQPIEKIFEPYFTSKHASVGTGIGLYMSKMIIEKNNHGTLTVENSEQGAKFTIAFL
jgi:C4-dicarboxylate-specific signal transduction histidine kinase